MKKDIQNVVITFSLIVFMLTLGSFFHTKKVIAEELAFKKEEERVALELEAQEVLQAKLLKINFEQESMLALQKQKEEEAANEAALADAIVKEEAVIPVTTVPTPSNTGTSQATLVAQQAEAVLQAKKQADALAAQVAAEKLAAEKLAQQKADAAAAAAAKKLAASKVRKSRAS